MKLKIFLIVFLLSTAFFNDLFSQSHPSYQTIVNALEHEKNITEDEELKTCTINKDASIEYLNGYFTGRGYECIVQVHLEGDINYRGMAFAMLFRLNNNKWVRERWHSSNIGGMLIEKQDINNDNIDEIIIGKGYFGMGVVESSYRLISLKNEVEKVIYSNSSYDALGGIENRINEECIDWFEVEYKDINHDNILEIIEKRKIGIVKKLNDDGTIAQTDYKKIKTVYYYTGGKYIKR